MSSCPDCGARYDSSRRGRHFEILTPACPHFAWVEVDAKSGRVHFEHHGGFYYDFNRAQEDIRKGKLVLVRQEEFEVVKRIKKWNGILFRCKGCGADISADRREDGSVLYIFLPRCGHLRRVIASWDGKDGWLIRFRIVVPEYRRSD